MGADNTFGETNFNPKIKHLTMETKVNQKQKEENYHLACQNCGTTKKSLHIIPLRNEKNVVGLIISCDDCDKELMGQRFDREIKFINNQ